jgi:ribonuclease HII
MDLFSFDRTYHEQGYGAIAGIDEAGRGPWAGPVVAAAVILPPGCFIKGLNDSKKLSPQKRELLFDLILRDAQAVGVASVDQEVIDSINILQATYRAMRNALQGISVPFDLVLVDGWAIPGLAHRQVALTGGDGRSASIAAASIIAKVTRDRLMTELSAHYPNYQFHRHKGYGTPEHQTALEKYGPCALHRKTFAPIRKYLEKIDKTS